MQYDILNKIQQCTASFFMLKVCTVLTKLLRSINWNSMHVPIIFGTKISSGECTCKISENDTYHGTKQQFKYRLRPLARGRHHLPEEFINFVDGGAVFLHWNVKHVGKYFLEYLHVLIERVQK